jgi:hypothetical protein
MAKTNKLDAQIKARIRELLDERSRAHQQHRLAPGAILFYEDALADVRRVRTWLDKIPVNLNIEVERTLGPKLRALGPALARIERALAPVEEQTKADLARCRRLARAPGRPGKLAHLLTDPTLVELLQEKGLGPTALGDFLAPLTGYKPSTIIPMLNTYAGLKRGKPRGARHR